MSDKNIIVWFRQDLRLSDNPALYEAAKAGNIIPLYILDDKNAGDWKIGGAGRWWLHRCLESLQDSLNGNLIIRQGDAQSVLENIYNETSVSSIYWNRCYEPWRIARDTKIKKHFQDQGLDIKTFNGSLLWEPWDIKKDDGTSYKVFTPFYRKGCLNALEPREPIGKPSSISYAETNLEKGSVDDLNLLPTPRWDKKMEEFWDISESGAQSRMQDFIDDDLKGYKEGRNFPAGTNVSRLSPHLHWGTVSPNQVWYTAKYKGEIEHLGKDLDHFLSELGWREFSYSLLYHFPDLPSKNLQTKFDDFPWDTNEDLLKLWQKGKTGYPIVDAAMRELYETGYMHNRTRMIVGSFLVKNLLLHWRHGEDWFWDCLVDADLANNAAGWQWIAGCGADAAPYFRIFNPITQGEKFDPEGEYVRRFVPELKDMPKEYIHKPWEASPLILKAADVTLGETYPYPIVDHKEARDKALAAFEKTKKAA